MFENDDLSLGVMDPQTSRVSLNGEYLDDRVEGMRYQPGVDRPYVEDRPSHPYRGHRCVRLQAGMKYNNETKLYEPRFKEYRIRDLQAAGRHSAVWNTNALPRQLWVHMLREVVDVFREPLAAYAAIRAKGTVPGVDIYRSATIEYEAVNDPGEVIEDMDVISDGRTDSPVFKTRSKPLTVIYGSFHFSDRRLRIAEGGGRSLSTMMHRFLTRRIAERVEDNTIGLVTGRTFGTLSGNYANAHDGTSTDYGMITHPARIQYTSFTSYTVAGWTPELHYNQVLNAIQTMRDNNFYGPYDLFYSSPWFQYLNRQFSVEGGNNASETLLSMLLKIQGVSSVRTLERWTTANKVAMLNNQTDTTVRAVDAMAPTLVQWDGMGGAKRNFRLMASQSVLWQYDYNGVLGVLDGTAS